MPAVIYLFPLHCSQGPVHLKWQGWVDSDDYGAGVGLYYFEVHRLVSKDIRHILTEDQPINPLMTGTVMHVGRNNTEQYQHNKTFELTEPGMYRYDSLRTFSIWSGVVTAPFYRV